MKNKNKIIAIIVAIALVASVFVIGTVANTKNTSIVISIDKTELSAGQSATVAVTASADYPVATASIPVFYDKTMVTVSDETATLTGYDVANVTTDLTATDASKIYANTDINSSKFGFVLVTYIGGANDTVSTLENATVLTFTITAKSDVSGEERVKCVTESAKTEENVAGMLYFGTTTSGTTITSIPENVENVDVSEAMGSTEIISDKTEIKVSTTGSTAGVVLDTTKTFGGEYAGVIYGFPQKAKNTFMNTTYLNNYLGATNEGTLEYSRSIGSTGYGTGTVVTVKNADGTATEAKYIVVIFGDIDGNGLINLNDATAVKAGVGTNNTKFAANSVQRMAANCQIVNAPVMMHTLNLNDATTVKAGNSSYIDQAALAAKMETVTAYYN